MEAILVLILIAWVLLFFLIFPVWSLIAIRRSERKADEALGRLQEVQGQLLQLRRNLPAQAEQPPPPPATALHPAADGHEEPPSRVEPPVSRPVPPPFIPEPSPESVPQDADGSPQQACATATEQPEPEKAAGTHINWERFMGVNLFAWVGGFVLFLGAAFFVKYSIDNNLISPQIRIIAGAVLGAGLLAGGLRLRGKDYEVTAHTLCATAILILYADVFAAHAFYGFVSQPIAFLLMSVITATAIALAIRLEGRVVAVLGLLGGFLTPPLLSTGQDNPLGLFGYVGFLDAGLLVVALNKRWHFLALPAAIGTALLQVGWTASYFEAAKIFTSMGVYFPFQILFALTLLFSIKKDRYSPFYSASAILLPFVALGFLGYLLTIDELGTRPFALFSFALVCDLCLALLATQRPQLSIAHRAAGLLTFFLLSLWSTLHLSPALLYHALALYLVFAFLHMVFPMVLQRFRPETKPSLLDHLLAPLALVLVLIPVFSLSRIPMSFWYFVLLLDILAIGFSLITASLFSLSAALVLTAATILVWMVRMPESPESLTGFLIVTTFFSTLFVATSLLAGKRIIRLNPAESEAAGRLATSLGQVPALAAILPFLLLTTCVIHLPVSNPSSIFTVGAFFVVVLLGLSHYLAMPLLALPALFCTAGLEYMWHNLRFSPDTAVTPLFWYILFYAIFAVYPFVGRKKNEELVIPWATAALAGPLQFHLVYRLMNAAYPNPYPGLLPALFSIPPLISLLLRARELPATNPARNGQLAWLGGVLLFFITLIFPIQFEHEWVLIGWALEGAALLRLFHKVPHPGLKIAGAFLLVMAFAGLANPAFVMEQQRGSMRILNWHLYTYGIVTACLMAGARWVSPPHHRIGSMPVQPILYTLAAIMAFLLMNIEIADYFSEGPRLTLRFSGNFARDMAYSIGWACFAFLLLIIGIRRRMAPARYGSILLLGCTILKLFFHDLASLRQLYRVGALMGVAVILILASYLYQRFVSFEPEKERVD